LKRELGNTSPQDNFSKWAKLDRQHNKAMAEFQKLGKRSCAETLPPDTSSALANALLSRWFPALAPVHLHFRRLDPALAWHPRPSICSAVLVLQVANVLGTRRVGAILRRMGAEFPARTSGKREHKHMGYRVRKYDRAGSRGSSCGLGTGHAQTNTCGGREAAREARCYGLQRRPEACREERIVSALRVRFRVYISYNFKSSKNSICLPTKDAKSSWLSLRHCNTSGMILADPLASSRLQIELVIVESSVSPSLRKSHLLI